MRILKIKAKNFLSIGEQGVEIDFTKYGNIIQIKGKNLDVSPQSSNGAGKSTISEIIVYGLYGKVIKDLSHKEVLNKKTKKNLLVEVEFEINEDRFKIIRTRKSANSGTLELFKNNVDLTRGGMPATQEAIEELIRLNYNSFINVACLGEHNNHAFLSLKADERRIVVENLLGLEKYVKYSKQASVLKNALESEQKLAVKKYETLVSQKIGIETRLENLNQKIEVWNKQKSSEISEVKKLIVEKRNELANSSDDGTLLLAFHQAKQKIEENKSEILKLEESRNKLSEALDQAGDKLEELAIIRQEHVHQVQSLRHAVEKMSIEKKGIEEQNNSLTKLKDGVKCSHCYGIISKQNYETVKLHNDNKIESLASKIELENSKIPLVTKKYEEVNSKLTKLKENKGLAEQKLSLITKKSAALISEITELSKVKEPNLSVKEVQLNEQLKSLESKLLVKEEELINDPYKDLIYSNKEELHKAEIEVGSCKTEIENRAKLLPYYEYWVSGFGDKGIRSFIIDEKLPALNARINYWLQFLIDNKLQLKFDREFEPTIERNPADGDPFIYHATSGGERRRINLAISQAFGYVTMVSSNIFVNMISLDEVALNVDLQGIHGIFKMINELARDRQVLVTTHDPNLMDLLDNCDVINVVKKDGFTTLM